MTRASAALFFHPDAYETGNDVMGRRAAGASFLRAWWQHHHPPHRYALVLDAAHAALVAASAPDDANTSPLTILTPAELAQLHIPGALFYPSPTLAEWAFRRGLADPSHRSWSLIGITHTTASAGAMDAIASLLTAPIQPWDALICTSRAVRTMVETLLENEFDRLRSRLGASLRPKIRLPLIPLGIHCDDFAFDPPARAQARHTLGLHADETAILFLGRLSPHAKAHPFPLYRALDRCAHLTGNRLVLIECGWFGHPSIATAYETAARELCPSVRRLVLDGGQAEQRRTAWAAADVFVSLADNIQETFGLTPIEAMAAGLPVIVSDWDGYRDTVRDGIDGFRIPTLAPDAGDGFDLAARYALGLANYDHYCGYASAFAAVDIEATAARLAELVHDPALRQRLGEAGRDRARSTFDWRHIIPLYEALFAELAETRRRAPALESNAPAWPARADPFAVFAAWPTQRLTAHSCIALSPECSTETALALRRHLLFSYATPVLPSETHLAQLIAALANGPLVLAQLIASRPPLEQREIRRAIVWLAKVGLCRVQPHPP